MSLCRLVLSYSECVFVLRAHALHERSPATVTRPLRAHARHAYFPSMCMRLLRATFLIAFASCYLIGLTGGVSEASAFSASRDTSGVGLLVEVKEKQQVGQGSSPFLTFAAIEQAWNMGWVDSIVTFFPEGKIALRLDKNVPEAASFTQKQASYMLRDSFRYKVTESFEFLEFRYKKGGKHPPFGKAQWSFRKEPTGKMIVAKVRVTLRKEGEHWLISGIRIQD